MGAVTMAPTSPRRRLALPISLALFAALSLATIPANAGDANPGTLKVHEAGELGDMRNDPHVGCEFFLEGFNMVAASGTITIKAWPPTGDKRVVLTGNWSADGGDANGHHFVAGPFTLAEGHYKAYVSNAPEHTKTKVFWVDGCQSNPPPPCVSTIGLESYHYYVVEGETYDSLDDVPLHAGDEVTVVFTLEGCGEKTLSFVSYAATEDFALEDQVVFDSDTGTFVEGVHTMDVIIPPCFYQVDFVFGGVIEHFNPPTVTYHAEGRFIDGTQGGMECPPETTTTPPPTTTGPSTEIPVFPSAAALAIGVGGAVVGSLFLLRRRL